MKVVEIFSSVQGEGLDVGIPCVFIRFAGCNRKCVWCDTDWTHGEEKSVSDILNEVAEYEEELVVLTGGEPMLQNYLEMRLLTEGLFDLGKYTAVETNGTLCLTELPLDLVAVSPKLSSSGRAFSNEDLSELISIFENYDAFLKFVIASKEDAEEAMAIIDVLVENDLLTDVVFQPEYTSTKYTDMINIVKGVAGDRLKGLAVRYLPQVHKLVEVK